MGLGKRGALPQVCHHWCTTSRALWCPQPPETQRRRLRYREESSSRTSHQQSCFAVKYTGLLQSKHLNFCRRFIGKVRVASWHPPQASSWWTGRGENASLGLILGGSQDGTFLDHFRSHGKEMCTKEALQARPRGRARSRRHAGSASGVMGISKPPPLNHLWTPVCNVLQV